MPTAYVALGSNLGDRLRSLSLAVDGLAHLPETHVDKVSHAYESDAAYHEAQPPFLNAVVEITTHLEPDALLMALHGIEDDLGRVRVSPNGPRTIDLDILLYGEEEWNSPELTLPHPKLMERDFVVTPLLEIAPRVTLPDGRHPRRSQADVGEVLRDLGPVPDAGVEHNLPVDAGEWVAVASSEGPQSSLAGYDAELDFKRSVLEQEGIPYAWQPFAPGAAVDVLGRPQVIELAVPEAYASRATALLCAVEAAPTVEPVEQAAEEAMMHGAQAPDGDSE